MEVLREVLKEALHLVSSPTYTCRKLVTMGGYSCNYKTDGEKYVCHDPGVYAWGVYCLVYSLGAGHDFSFDAHMSKFGCEVFTFDDDLAHRSYPTHMGERLWFYKIRIGTDFLKQYYRLTSAASSSASSEVQVISYGPLPSIRTRLKHRKNHLHYLKVDIEGQEWQVLEQSLFKSDILRHTQQLGLEIHLDGLMNTGNDTQHTTHLTQTARKYLRVLKGLRSRGFHLAHWEPNYLGSKVITVAGLTFHVYSETLWVNLRFKPKINMPSQHLPPPVLFE